MGFFSYWIIIWGTWYSMLLFTELVVLNYWIHNRQEQNENITACIVNSYPCIQVKHVIGSMFNTRDVIVNVLNNTRVFTVTCKKYWLRCGKKKHNSLLLFLSTSTCWLNIQCLLVLLISCLCLWVPLASAPLFGSLMNRWRNISS